VQGEQQNSPGLITILVSQDDSNCNVLGLDLPDWAIAVIVVGAVLIAGAVILISVFVSRHNSKKEGKKVSHKLSTGNRSQVQ
jgi:hypothetical protein